MAFDAFLKIDGLEGEVLSSKHKGEIEVLSFSWGATQPASSGGGGGGAGRVQIHDLSIVKRIDKSSPVLFEKTCSGQHIPEVHLTLANKANQMEFLKVKLSDVLISSYQTGGSSSGGTDAVEQLSLRFNDLLIDAADAQGRWTTQVSCGGFNALVRDTQGEEHH